MYGSRAKESPSSSFLSVSTSGVSQGFWCHHHFAPWSSVPGFLEKMVSNIRLHPSEGHWPLSTPWNRLKEGQFRSLSPESPFSIRRPTLGWIIKDQTGGLHSQGHRLEDYRPVQERSPWDILFPGTEQWLGQDDLCEQLICYMSAQVFFSSTKIFGVKFYSECTIDESWQLNFAPRSPSFTVAYSISTRKHLSISKASQNMPMKNANSISCWPWLYLIRMRNWIFS